MRMPKLDDRFLEVDMTSSNFAPHVHSISIMIFVTGSSGIGSEDESADITHTLSEPQIGHRSAKLWDRRNPFCRTISTRAPSVSPVIWLSPLSMRRCTQ